MAADETTAVRTVSAYRDEVDEQVALTDQCRLQHQVPD